MSKTTTDPISSPLAPAAPQAPPMYEILHAAVGHKPDGGGPYLKGEIVTADQLLPGLDPDYIERRIPELIALGAIKPV